MQGAPWAHSRNASGHPDLLVTHLRDTAALARTFASAFGAGELAYWLGLWHDLGKFHPEWQDYLRKAAEWERAGRSGLPPSKVDHKAAGAQLAVQERMGTCAFVVQGHHGGLTNRAELKAFLADERRAGPAREALLLARETIPDLTPSSPPPLPAFIRSELQAELFIRMLFSAVVDADFLDTEEHFAVDRAALRGTDLTLSRLWERFEANEWDAVRAGKRAPTVVNGVRAEVLDACLASSSLPPGFFRLTVPTGGGKTRSGMAFALRHALEHGLRRVIVAVPFITIAAQTAASLTSAFDSPAPDDVTRAYQRLFGDSAVLQHYSGGAGVEGDFRARLASENWDAPVIVTSTVQLFESLFSNRPAACRKLHRLARSVIILDEAQALPAHLLQPILDGLRALVADYGATVVLSTATQPAFNSIPGSSDLAAREMVPGFEQHFAALRRVRFSHEAAPLDWAGVAQRMLSKRAAMTVVNTRQHAGELFAELRAMSDEETAFHLSTRMVQRHRDAVLDTVRERLREGLPCYLVSTQVVEAGIDIDFPLVLRAIAPMDSIVQAAGRCNREGSLGIRGGEVVVFHPTDGAMPPGPYRVGAEIVSGVLSRGEELDDLAVQQRYWRDYLRNVDTDRPQVQSWRKALDYREVAKRFEMIEPTASLAVPQMMSAAERDALNRLARGEGGRASLRALQGVMVGVRVSEFGRLAQAGLVREVQPGLGEWLGEYGAAGIELPP